MISPEFRVESFSGDKDSMAEIAALHLKLRYWQRANGQSQFPGRILDSQDDLRSIDANYTVPGGNFFIATWLANGAIAGFVGMKRVSAERVELMRLATMPEYHRRGIATALVGTAIDWAAETGFQKVTLSTGYSEAGGSVYERYGFVDLGDNPTYEDTYDMELALGA